MLELLRKNGMARIFLLFSGAGLATFLGQLASRWLLVNPVGTTIVWIPGAAVLAFMATNPRQHWPAILAGACFGGALAFHVWNNNFSAGLVGYSGTVALLYVTGRLIHLPQDCRPLFEQLTGLFRFSLFAMILFPLAAAAWSVLIIQLVSGGLQHFGEVWFLTIPCFAAGSILLAPIFCRLPDFYKASPEQRKTQIGASLGYCTLNLMIAATLWVLMPTIINRLPYLLFCTVPLLVIAAIRLPPLGLSLLMAVSVTPSIAAAIHMDGGNKNDLGAVYSQVMQWSIIAIAFLVHAFSVVFRIGKFAEEQASQTVALAINQQEEERAAVSRELHDSVGQRIALAAFTLGNLEQRHSIDGPDPIESVRMSLIDILGEIRAMSRSLHPRTMSPLGIQGSLHSLCDEIADSWRGSVIADIRTISHLPDATVSHHLYRIAQEALRNAVEHGNPLNIWVRLYEPVDGTLVMEIEDDGVGFSPENIQSMVGLGLISMRERCRQIDASIDILSGNGRRGTCLCFQLQTKTPPSP